MYSSAVPELESTLKQKISVKEIKSWYNIEVNNVN